MSNVIEDVLHTVLDVLSGRRNVSAAEADALHEAISPGYTTPQASQEQLDAARALLAQQDQHEAYKAAQDAPAAPEPVAPADPEPAPADATVPAPAPVVETY